MKKILMTGIAAATICAGFTSCTHDDFETATQAGLVKATYDQAFLEYVGGSISPEQDWGFGSAKANARMTRALDVNGDTYNDFTAPTAGEIAAVFPTAIPSNADEIKDLTTIYPGKGLYNIYMDNGANHNYKITSAGEVAIGGGWYNNVWAGDHAELKPYNVYVNVGQGNKVTIKKDGTAGINLYIISGEVTIDKNANEIGGIISVAEGATLIDQRDHIASNNYLKVYNRGTYNAVNTEKFDIGNNATFYNEGTFTSTGMLSFTSGAGNTSYFINMGDESQLTAPSMTLNSTCHFYTDGKVDIAGETKVTQNGITWVNNGHYTTGSLQFSAQNTSFYNYCQLIVKGNCNFTDGDFEMMDNSYAEFNTGLFDNFVAHMGNQSYINIKSGSKWARQGAGTQQGFFTKGGNAKAYVHLGGTTKVPVANGGALQVGANITLGYEDMKFYKNVDGASQYSQYENFNLWDETTAEQLQASGDSQITWALDPNAIIYTGADLTNLDFTLQEGQCGVTLNNVEDPGEDPTVEYTYDLRIIAEDLSVTSASDFDFNDVVLDVRYAKEGENQTILCLRAAGGTLPLRIAGRDDWEVHQLFGQDVSVMVNTSAKEKGLRGVDNVESVTFTFPEPIRNAAEANEKLTLEVKKAGEWMPLTAQKGEPAAKLAVDPTYTILKERTSIKEEYEHFVEWATGTNFNSRWW